MGGVQSDSKTKDSLEELYKIVKRSSDGLSMLEERSTGKEYLLREITSNLQNDFERIKAAIEKRRTQTNEHLLAIRETYTRTESNLCSNDYKLFLMVEYPFRNLQEEVQERRLAEDYFRQNELWSIIYSCCIGLKQIYAYQGRHEALSTDRVYIEKDGLVKIGDPYVLGHNANCDLRFGTHPAQQHIYLSPEQMEMMLQSKGGYSPEQSDVFTLAMIMLEVACLTPMSDIYEEGNSIINSDKIQARLTQVEKRYSFKLRFMLEKMLAGDPKQRITLSSIESAIQRENFDEDESRSSGVPYSNAPTEHPPSVFNGKRLEEVKPKPAPNLTSNGPKEAVVRHSTAETNPDKPQDRETLDRLPLQQLYLPPNIQPTASPAFDYGKYGGGSFSTAPYSLKFNSFGSVGGLDYTSPYGMGGATSYYTPSLGLGTTSTYPMSTNFGSYTSSLPMYPPSTTLGYGTTSSYSSTFKPSSFQAVGPYMPTSSISSDPYMASYKPAEGMQFGSTLSNDSKLPPRSPVDVFSQPAKQPTSVDANRISPPAVSKESLSPVQQLETPERRDKQNRNPNAPINNEGSNSASHSSGNSNSAYQQVASLLPNSTIAEVTETEFSGSSENSLKYEVLDYEQGSRYEGYTLRGMRHGFGKFYYQDGGHYQGEWRDNKMNGFAKLYYQNNDLAYEGMWKDDQFHGKGKVFNDNPRKIEGCFDYTNLSALDECWIFYEGEFDEDSKHGHGMVKLSNNETFEGQFERDVINGQGRFRTLKGDVIHGVWRENRLMKRLD